MKLKPFHRVGFLAALFYILTAGQSRADLPPEAQAAVNRGINAAKQQDYLQAIGFFQDARKIAPNAPEIFFNLGVAESKIPGRELRAICWFGAYLAATTNAPNATAVKNQIDSLEIKSKAGLLQLIQTLQDTASKQRDSQGVGDNGWIKSENWYIVAGLWAGADDLTNAWKILDFLPVAFDKDRAREAIAKAQADAGDIAGAQKTAELIQDTNNIPVENIAWAQLRRGDNAGALKTVDLVPNDDDTLYHKDSLYQDIAVAQAKAGDIEGAQKTADMIQDEKHLTMKWLPYFAVIEAQLNSGDIAGARETVMKTATFPKSWDDNSILIAQDIAMAAEAQAKAGDTAGAQKTADVIQDTGWKSETLQSIAIAQVKAGDITNAFKTVDLLQDIGPNQQWKSGALKSIADAQAIAGNITNALKTAELLEDAGPNGQWKSFAQQSIAEIQANAGDITGAQKTVNLIQDKSYKPPALQVIAAAQARVVSTNVSFSTASLKTVSQTPENQAIPVYNSIYLKLNYHEAIPSVKVSDWLKLLDDDGSYFIKSDYPTLNTAPFLNLAGLLAAIHSDNPENLLNQLGYPVEKIVTAKNIIDQMLQQQAQQETTQNTIKALDEFDVEHSGTTVISPPHPPPSH